MASLPPLYWRARDASRVREVFVLARPMIWVGPVNEGGHAADEDDVIDVAVVKWADVRSELLQIRDPSPACEFPGRLIGRDEVAMVDE